MPKHIKGTSSRKPPAPNDSHEVIDAWLGDVMPKVNPLVTRLDALIREGLPPDTYYAIKWGKAYYGLPDLGWVIELAAYHKSANVVFHGGADFDSPPPHGDADRSRYIKVNSLDEAEQPELREWIAEAVRVAGWQ